MGNRAVVTFSNSKRFSKNIVGVYLHWNGGRDSIESLLLAAKELDSTGGLQGIRARFIQAATTLLDGGYSVYVDNVGNLDCNNGDNGLYVVNDKCEIIARYHADDISEQDEYDRKELSGHILGLIDAGRRWHAEQEAEEASA